MAVIDPAKLAQVIERFFELLEGGTGSPVQNQLCLADLLDELAALGRHAELSFDDGHPDPPRQGAEGYRHVRELAEVRFPGLSFYNIPDPIASRPGEALVVVGDPYDDIADIAGDLFQVRWCLANTTARNASWHFRFGYDSHWGEHVNNLRWYLYARSYDR